MQISKRDPDSFFSKLLAIYAAIVGRFNTNRSNSKVMKTATVAPETRVDQKINPRTVRNAVHNVVSFIKENTANNIVEANRQKKLELNPEQLRVIISIVQSSIEEGFIKGSGEIDRALK